MTSFRSQLLDGDETAHVQPGSGRILRLQPTGFPSGPTASDPFRSPLLDVRKPVTSNPNLRRSISFLGADR